MTRLIVFVVVFVITGCVQLGDRDGICGASALRDLIGQPVTALVGVELPDNVRMIGPDSLVTTDLQPGRLNVWFDDAEVIERIDCG